MSQTTAFSPVAPIGPTDNVFTISAAFRIGFGSWLRYLVAFTAMSVVLHAPLLAWVYQVHREAPDDVERWNRMSLGLTLGTHLVSALLAAMVIQAVCARLDGRPASVVRVITTGVRRGLPALAVASLVGLLIGVASLLLYVPGVIVSCMLYVAVPASVVERPGIFGALKRSARLTKGSRGAIFGLSILIGIVLFAGTLLLFGLYIGFSDESRHQFPIASLLASVLFAPLMASMSAAAYVLLRRERDGVDTATLVGVFE